MYGAGHGLVKNQSTKKLSLITKKRLCSSRRASHHLVSASRLPIRRGILYPVTSKALPRLKSIRPQS